MKSTEQVIKELKQEKAELSAKIEKLKKFLGNDKLVTKVGKWHADLLRCQLSPMEDYEYWLEERICDLERKLKK
ncbi:MAG: hypothetical protein MRZ40_10235 [Ligilactobacillus animalis]|uniref:crAss001_48 related protein n=1 Tax=Ligilactobacillus animalis TaxID=1605 RepID=UPI00242B7A01|nr:hypothetical protein [Ligilactobacillus animalis]MCI5942931.1 hypothetical protein [Ligilactobacillus animalis]MDY2993765.1 hypothetical protein [Ligilactobacillus animalis]